MKVLYDYQIFARQYYGGISRYFFDLTKQMKADNLADTELAVGTSSNEYLKKQGIISEIQKRMDISVWDNYSGKAASVRALKGGAFDVFHPTYYNPYFLEHLHGKPFVLTVHDMIHEKFPEKFSGKDDIRAAKRMLMEQAAAIVAVSENTKADIIRLTGISGKKIYVVHHATRLAASEQYPDRVLPKPYVLFVGNRGGYKNFGILPDTLAFTMENHGLHIVCAGGEPLTAKEKECEHIIRYPADDATLAILYSNALCMITPSLYEGFGIPMIEAFACGCPVLASNAGSLPEIGGDAAWYFNSSNPVILEYAVAILMSSNDARARLIQLGKERLKIYSWEQTAKKTAEVYRSVA